MTSQLGLVFPRTKKQKEWGWGGRSHLLGTEMNSHVPKTNET